MAVEQKGVTWAPSTRPEDHPMVNYQGFHPGRITHLPRGHTRYPGRQAFAVDVILEEDVAVKLRDGTTIYTNIYRPREGKAPAMLAWSPYGKSGNEYAPTNYDRVGPYGMGIPYDRLSGYERFEGPNPAEWTARGYAIVDPDPRGTYNSEGDINWWNLQEAQDIHDTIDWISRQSDWCDGNVVMMGNSWLAISQINVAARCPHPALKAIAPWEAMTDMYSQAACRGGRPSITGFLQMLMSGFSGRNRHEDPFAALSSSSPASHRHLLYDDYWKDKSIPVEEIDIPMYLTASYSSGVHSHGSFLNFATENKANEHKWLRVHATQEWYDIYRPEATSDLARFYDYYAKYQTSNGWNLTPRLRLSLLGFEAGGGISPTICERPELSDSSFPLKRTVLKKLYLSAASSSSSSSSGSPSSGSLLPSPPQTTSSTSHNAHFSPSSSSSIPAENSDDKSTFSFTFPKYTELSGWPWARIYVRQLPPFPSSPSSSSSSQEKKEMDIVLILRKTSVEGKLLEQATFPSPISISDLPQTNVSRYLGPSGYLRASHRGSLLKREGEGKDGEDWGYPVYGFDEKKKGVEGEEGEEEGEIIRLDIPIWPIGMTFAEGEGLRLDVAGRDMAYKETEGTEDSGGMDENWGRHEIVTAGGKEGEVGESGFLVLPVIEGGW